jgi:ankyrin repeat protein
MHDSTRRHFLRTGLVAGAVLVAARVAHAAGPGPRSGGDAERRARFLAAIVAGREAEVAALLAEEPALVNAADDAGRSALVLAYLAGQEPVAATLRLHGAAIGLIEAVMIPDWDRATELGTADPAALDAWHPVGGSSLYASVRAGRDDTYILQDLGADPDANPRGRFGVTPAFGAIECRHPGDALRCLVALLSNGAHVNAPQREGDTLLHAAARRGDPALVRYLLRRGADWRVRDARGHSALAQAEAAGHAAVVALLRQPELVPRDDTSLRYAFDASGGAVVWPDLSDVPQKEQSAVTGPSHAKLDKVKAAVGQEPRRSFSRSTQNELAIEACGHTGNREIMRYHLDHGVPQSLCTSISIGDLPRAKALLAAHPTAIHERGPHDFALLFYAAIGGGSVEAAELLLDAGVPVNQESQGTTALHWAADRGQLDLVRFLAERGADLDAVGYKFDRNGQRPLQLALESGEADMVKLLEDLGAS